MTETLFLGPYLEMLYIVLFVPSRWMSTYDRLRIREIQFFIPYYECRPTTVDGRRPSTVDRRSRTDDCCRSTVDGRRLSTDDRRPSTVDRRPTTYDHRPTKVDDPHPTTVVGQRSSTDDRQLTIVDQWYLCFTAILSNLFYLKKTNIRYFDQSYIIIILPVFICPVPPFFWCVHYQLCYSFT